MAAMRTAYQTIPDASPASRSSGPGFFARRPRILWIRGAISDLSVLAPLIIAMTIAVSSTFYFFYNNWHWTTAFYYSCQTIVGIMYGVPEGEDRISQSVTLFLYFLGATYIYAAVAAYANLIAERTVRSAKDIALMEHVEGSQRGVVLPRHWMQYMCNQICNALDWNHNKYKLITVGATIGWICLGVTYGFFYEKYDWYTSVYFALDAMMLAGTLEPPCDEDGGGGVGGCSLGPTRSLFMSVYLLVGSPLFILTMGQFYESLVSSAQLNHQRKKYLTQFTQEEFDYAATTLRSKNYILPASPTYVNSELDEEYHNRSVDLAQFILLELLRTEAINHDEILYLRSVFDAVDADKSGTVEYDEIEDACDAFADQC